MSKQEYMAKIGIPAGHDLVERQKSDWGVRKGQDIDTYYYDHVDENGKVLAQYIVKDITSTFPPFARSVTVEKTA